MAEKTKKLWQIKIFPNPASNRVTIESNVPGDILMVEIRDLSGRLLFKQDLKTENFITNLDLNLIDGAYLVKITNSRGETLTKKLLISR